MKRWGVLDAERKAVTVECWLCRGENYARTEAQECAKRGDK
jgi:hypothetical protein